MFNLDQFLLAQVRSVDRRVQNANAFHQHSVEIRHVARSVAKLQESLGLNPPVASLTPPTAKPHVLLRYVKNDEHFILKVYGRRHSGEARVQAWWHSNGVPCAEPIEFGDEPYSWMLMRFAQAESTGNASMDEVSLLSATREMAAIASAAHYLAVPTGEWGRYSEHAATEFSASISALRCGGFNVDSSVFDLAAMVYAPTPQDTLIHGDLCPANCLKLTSGAYSWIDAGGYLGEASIDAARWIVRTTPSLEATETLVSEWIVSEPSLDYGSLRRAVALESYIEAGVGQIVKSEQRLTSGNIDIETVRLLEQAKYFTE
ncbi:phosphotransferase [Streptomyces sp. NPDC101209]|uniref:phosphotransferase n=1 Tax=Streptomyces sp. NPDC101209 TaxID=3366129 RepID=UPI0038220E73